MRTYPTPWSIDGADCVNDAKGMFVAHNRDLLGDEDLMTFVVARVNAHDELVAALKAIKKLTLAYPLGTVNAEIHTLARAALAKAEG